MDLKQMLEEARQREVNIHMEFDIKTEQYKRKVLENDKIRRNLEKEEEGLKKQIPEQHFVPGSEWSKVLEEIRVLESLVERSMEDV